jgi:outer membrane biosynthesis protein TonB
MSNKPGNKILRIGLIQNGRIVEERLMRSAKPITIGHGLKKNTLVVPASDLPKSFKVFEPKDGGYLLYFTSKMSGRISLGDGVQTLEELARQGRAKKSGDGYVLELHQKARGKLNFGEVTILFQFVTPPPARPKPVLPASMRGGWFKNIEPFLGAIVAISAIVQIGFVVWLENQDFPPDELREAEIADRFVKIMAEPEPEEPEIPEEKTEPTEGEGEGEPQEKEKAPKPEPKPQKEKVEKKEEKPKTAEERAAAEAERRKRMAEKVRKSTILHEIGAVAGEDGNLANTLDDGAGSTTMKEAFEGSTGMKSAELGAEKSGVRSSGSSDAEASGSASGINLGQTSGAKAAQEGVDTGSKEETKVKAKIELKGGGEPIGTGKLSASRISSVVRRGASGIQRCYERVLKQNPNESGKLIITVTIGQAGRVTNVAVKTGIGGGFDSCVKSRVKSWRFPRPKGGDVMFNKTFVLSK